MRLYEYSSDRVYYQPISENINIGEYLLIEDNMYQLSSIINYGCIRIGIIEKVLEPSLKEFIKKEIEYQKNIQISLQRGGMR